ncbi:MAG: hypothetical protein DRI30_01310 [Chloroflexi bacterium]|nr:MAG: hypothetical protein DRI30_01310 [Chloroflexota bacterium]
MTRDRSYLERARLMELHGEDVPEIDDLVEYLQISWPEAVARCRGRRPTMRTNAKSGTPRGAGRSSRFA